MTLIAALVILWIVAKLAAGVGRTRRMPSPARELYERRLRDAGRR